MPYTRKQVKLFFSSGSPLSEEQQEKVHAELHADPSLGHAKKGSAALKKKSKPKASGMDWRKMWGRNKVKGDKQ